MTVSNSVREGDKKKNDDWMMQEVAPLSESVVQFTKEREHSVTVQADVTFAYTELTFSIVAGKVHVRECECLKDSNEKMLQWRKHRHFQRDRLWSKH